MLPFRRAGAFLLFRCPALAVFFSLLAGTAPAQNAALPSAPATAISVQQMSEADASESPAASDSGARGEEVSFYTAIDLALRNSKSVLMAQADLDRVRASWREIRDYYVPSLAVGSGLGYSYGFPLGTPNLFNVTSTSLLYSSSQRFYIRSMQEAVKAATFSLKNTRQQVILDAALTYIELNKSLGEIAALQHAISDSDQLLSIMEQRQQAGLETNIQMTQTRLGRAQVQLRRIQMEDHAEELSNHLAGLTGLDAARLAPIPSSIPEVPETDRAALNNQGRNAPAVEAVFATARSKFDQYAGDRRQNYRPTVNFVLQYERFSTFNNYQDYYKTQKNGFPLNNLGVGIQATWPLFDLVKRNKAQESAADAVHGQRQAELAVLQTEESNLALWHSLRELEAQEQVADLQQQLAQATLASTETQLNGTAPNGTPATPQQAEQQRIDERNSYVDLKDAQFNVTKVKLNLLNAMGELEAWARQSGSSGPPLR